MDNEPFENNNTESTTNDNTSPLTTAYNDTIAAYSFSSAFDSRLSTRSSTSSSISGWAPRARSSSVSSHGSNDSVNLDALIAGGSDINEECPLDLEEGDDMVADWSKEELQLVEQELEQELPIQVQQGQRSRRSTGASASSSMLFDDRQSDEYWDEPEEEDPAFDETLKGFSQLSMKTAIPEVRGLTSPKQLRATGSSSRFPDGRNPFDLDADYMDMPSGLASPSPSNNRLSTLSQDSNISNRSSISSIGGSRLQPPGVSRLPGAASGLKAPASRLAQPGSRTATGVPQPASKMGISRPSGMQQPKSSGIQAPKTGLQTPRASGLQAPRTGSSSSLVKPSATGVRAGVATATGSRLTAPGSRVPSKTGSGIAPPSTTRSQIAAPGTIKRAGTTGARNGSGLLPPSTVTSRSASSSSLMARSGSTTASRTLTSPQRSTSATPSQLTSPTRVPSGRLSSASSYLVSPTSSQSSNSSLPSLAHARDTVTPLSRRLSNATGTSQLMRPKAAGTGGAGASRSLSMYGSSSSLLPTSGRTSQQQQYYHQAMEDEADYAVLTPPQSPSSKRVMGNGPTRSGMVMPSRLAAPTVSTSRVPRSTSPGPMSAGSSSGSSFLPRSHTPTSGGLSISRISSGLISPRAGRS
ncbi:hypothetical protein BGW39_010049 [Mortierella sp. 14UC]|nr:hypothetical protein BGW39_010049 [Mortierella sp. 14UC]